MAARQLNEQILSNFTIQLYRGIPYTQLFTWTNDDGSPIVLTGKVIEFIFKDVFPTQIELSSDGAPTTLGSKVEIIDDEEGEFKLTISESETLTAYTGGGKWWMLLDGELIHLDNVNVCDV